jgi:hypothetical protein
MTVMIITVVIIIRSIMMVMSSPIRSAIITIITIIPYTTKAIVARITPTPRQS